MSKLTALALSIAVLGGVWAFLALNPLAGVALVWVGFIAWGCYFAAGADGAALQKTIAGMIFGAIMAGVAFIFSWLRDGKWFRRARCTTYYRCNCFPTSGCGWYELAFSRSCKCVWLCSNSRFSVNGLIRWVMLA